MNDKPNLSTDKIHVVAGVIRDGNARVLLAQRPHGKDLAGFWEFPGGKVEPGEHASDALTRELDEELGIRARIGTPIICVPHGRIRLDVRAVDSYDGQPRSREGQALRWMAPEDVDLDRLAHADRAVIAALRLPDRYLITPTPSASEIPAFLRSIDDALANGIRLVQLRLAVWPREQVAPLARVVRDRCREHGASLLLNADWRLAEVLGVDGVHLPSRIAATLKQRPVAGNRWLAVSCHNAEELHHAASIGADFATLSPSKFTPGHADSMPMDGQRSVELIADAPLPVFALGGMQIDDIDRAIANGAQGIAATRSLWNSKVEL